MEKPNREYVKQRTNELYAELPMDVELRMAQKSVRDEIINLNYSFFGYIAKSVIIESISYEDKLQTALMSFMRMWWKYKLPPYREDLAFTVFFKPRLS